MERNIEALKGVRERILEDRLVMGDWFNDETYELIYDENYRPVLRPVTQAHINNCGTHGCLAGWAFLNEAFKSGRSLSEVTASGFIKGAGELLGLDCATAIAAFLLNWPNGMDTDDHDDQLRFIDGLIDGWYYDGHWRYSDGTHIG